MITDEGINRDLDEHLLGAVTQEDLEVQQLLADNVEQALQEQQQQEQDTNNNNPLIHK